MSEISLRERVEHAAEYAKRYALRRKSIEFLMIGYRANGEALMWTHPQSMRIVDAKTKWLIYTAIGLDMQRNGVRDYVMVTEVWEAKGETSDGRSPAQREDRTEAIMALGARGDETCVISMDVERDRKGRFSKISRRRTDEPAHVEMVGPMGRFLTCKSPRDKKLTEILDRLAEESRVVVKPRPRVH